jgi:hypothetical protein
MPGCAIRLARQAARKTGENLGLAHRWKEVAVPESTFSALEQQFPDVVAKMGDYFDSHDFILRLAQSHQRLYVAALAAYGDREYPFQIVHAEIARRLLKHPDLVRKVGEHSSPDIFGQKTSASVWYKV